MASKDELRAAILAARHAENSADKSLKRLADIKAPKAAHKALSALREKLRSIQKRMAKRIPALKKRLESKRKSGVDKAVAWAKAQNGRAETGSTNTGPYPVSECQVFTIGYDGVPWCGCFVSYAAIHEGGANIPNKARLAYTPYAVADAQNHTNGLTAVGVNDARPGDFLLYDFDGGGADHVGLCVAPTSGGMVYAVEGNTSSGTSGSQSNGGGVYARTRPVSQVTCVARPAY